MSYVTKNGEITTKEMLINEIESLLNRIPSNDITTLSRAIMSGLTNEELEQIRNHLLNSNSLLQNRQWLLNLATKDDE